MQTGPRPFVRLNYAMTADGKISSADGTFAAFGSRRDRARVDSLRAEADMVLIGAGTLRAEDPPVRVADAAGRRRRLQAGRPEQPLRGVLSASLDFPPAGRFFSSGDAAALVLTVDHPPAAALARLEGRAELLCAGSGRVDLPRALSLLWARGVRQLLVEGGGSVNASFLEAGLVDEVFLTLCPILAGGATAPSPVEGGGFPPARMPRLRLLDSETTGGEIFCRYVLDGGAAGRET